MNHQGKVERSRRERMSVLRLSVALCTYNGATYLPEQLESLLRQKRRPDEVVVGDDSSTDDSWNLLQAFAVRARALGINVRLQRHPSNIGYVENFSTTLSQACGDIVLLCDQDDVWRSDKLAIMERCFVDDPDLLLLCTDARLVDAHGQPMKRTLFEALELSHTQLEAVHGERAFEEVLLHRTMATGATMAVRQCLLDIALPVGAGWIHDEWLAIVAAALGRVDALEQTLIDYRQHGSNQVGVPVRDRTWGTKWRNLRRPRSNLLQRDVDRLGAIAQRLQEWDSARMGGHLKLIEDRRSHFMRRIEIGHLPHLQRIAPAWREARSGAYRRYGTGVRSMLRDLLRRG